MAGNDYARSSSKPSKQVTIKVGMVGDSGVGKTSLMVKYVDGSFDEDYIQTLGVNFMDKTVSVRGNEITFSIWDLGGRKEFLSMLPLVCNDALAILFMFDLTRKSTLVSVKDWYRQARAINTSAKAILIGTKYDLFEDLEPELKAETTLSARKFAKAMKAPLVFCSARGPVNIQQIFKICLSKVFDLNCNLEKNVDPSAGPVIDF